MFHSIKFRWAVAALIAVGVIGLAMAGGNWKIATAETIPGGTIPDQNLFQIMPYYVTYLQQKVIVEVSWPGNPIDFPVGYTYIVFDQVGGNRIHKELVPTKFEQNKLTFGADPQPYLPGDIMGNTGLWNVRVHIHHYDGSEEFSNNMSFVVDKASLYLPTILNKK